MVCVSNRAYTGLGVGPVLPRSPSYTSHSAARSSMFHLAGRAAVGGTQPRNQQNNASLARSHLPDQHEEDARFVRPPVEPAHSHSPQDEGPAALHSAWDDGERTAETSPVSPELAGGPLGYRDRKAPAWPGRGADAPLAPAEAPAAGSAGGVVAIALLSLSLT